MQRMFTCQVMQRALRATLVDNLSVLSKDTELLWAQKTLPKAAKHQLETMFDLQVTYKAPGYTYIGALPWGISEIRFCVSGSESLVAMPYTSVPGESLEKKKDFLKKGAPDDLSKAAKDALVVDLRAGDALFIPDAFFVAARTGSEVGWGLRWGVDSSSLNSNSSASELAAYLTDLMLSMPTLNGTAYRVWADVAQARARTT